MCCLAGAVPRPGIGGQLIPRDQCERLRGAPCVGMCGMVCVCV